MRLVFRPLTNISGKQMLVYYSELTAIRRYMSSSFRKSRQPFASKCFMRELVLLDLAHLERPIVYLWAHMHRTMIHRLPLCYTRLSKHRNGIFLHFFAAIDASFFWAIFKLCGIQREYFFLTAKCPCNIECMRVELMPKYASWRLCNISSRRASMLSSTTADFGRISRNSSKITTIHINVSIPQNLSTIPRITLSNALCVRSKRTQSLFRVELQT